MKQRFAAVIVLVASLAVLAAGCGGGGSDEASPTATAGGTTAASGTTAVETSGQVKGGAEPGGTYRVDVESAFDFTDAFDPTGEYTSIGWSFYTMLVRKLVTYRHTAGAAGSEPLPDLAADFPTISEDGLTYTFTLKDGIMFGPPASREITSQDIAYAFERLANPDLGGAGYPNYYVEIVGFEEFGAGESDSITGIETPDDKTIVFTLEKPVGDFLYRLAMPATGPIPEEVAKCYTAAGDYGRYVVSSGPYMIEGSDALDMTSCETMKPIAGYDPEAHLFLVRNPAYDPATDSTELRENLPDRFEFTINSNADDCFARVREALIEDTMCAETGKELKAYTEDEELQDNLKLNPDDTVYYISLNLALPPFDDVHVRKAANLVMDKTALIRAWGGPTAGDPATYNLTPSLAPADLAGYDPYPSPNFEGDVAAAMEEMKLSKYDTDKDGLCDAPECTDVLSIQGTTARDKGMVPVLEESFGQIGIALKTRQVDDPFSIVFDPTNKIPLNGVTGFSKDYPDAYTFFLYLFDGRGIAPGFSYNQSLVGLTEETAAEIGIPYPPGGVPSVDAGIDRCSAIADNAARSDCWGELTKTMMEDVVPTVPYLWSNATTIVSDAVTQWDFDQATSQAAWVHVAVDPEKQNQ